MTHESSAVLAPTSTPAEAKASRGQLSSLWRAMRHLEGRRLWIGLGLLVLGTLSEGAAIMTFLPVLQLVGAGGTTIDLSGLDFPGAGLLQALQQALGVGRDTQQVRGLFQSVVVGAGEQDGIAAS